jgi:hypothetical protein
MPIILDVFVVIAHLRYHRGYSFSRSGARHPSERKSNAEHTPIRTSTSVALACFAARIAWATSACVILAGWRAMSVTGGMSAYRLSCGAAAARPLEVRVQLSAGLAPPLGKEAATVLDGRPNGRSAHGPGSRIEDARRCDKGDLRGICSTEKHLLRSPSKPSKPLSAVVFTSATTGKIGFEGFEGA